jgi:hypothetical protein
MGAGECYTWRNLYFVRNVLRMSGLKERSVGVMIMRNDPHKRTDQLHILSTLKNTSNLRSYIKHSLGKRNSSMPIGYPG